MDEVRAKVIELDDGTLTIYVVTRDGRSVASLNTESAMALSAALIEAVIEVGRRTRWPAT